MSTFATPGEIEPAQPHETPEESIAALLVDCHDFVEQVLAGRQSKSVQQAAVHLLSRLGDFVKWETLH
jgi:hypothetical protein